MAMKWMTMNAAAVVVLGDDSGDDEKKKQVDSSTRIAVAMPISTDFLHLHLHSCCWLWSSTIVGYS